MSTITQKARRGGLAGLAVAGVLAASLAGAGAANAAEEPTSDVGVQSVNYTITKKSTLATRAGSSYQARAAIANGGLVYYAPWSTGSSYIELSTTSGYQYNRVGDQPTSSTSSRYYVNLYL